MLGSPPPDRKRRSGSLYAILIGALLCASSAAAQTPDLYPGSARSYLLVRDGRILSEREPTLALQPASLTKLLTALVVLDANWEANRWLTVSAEVAGTPPTRLGLRAKEQITAGSALAAMLIRSANDACRALVENAAPDTATFVARMNERAAKLNMKSSRFVDPCGFDAPGQHSTVTDLFKLAQVAHAVPLIARLAATPEAKLVTRGGREIKFSNTNQLLGRLAGTEGLKTGNTSQAGQCLIAYVRRDDHEVWLILLGGSERWWLAHGMIDNAFATAR